MSAFVVSKTHIDVIVGAAVKLGATDPTSIGAMLWAENFKSVNHRYDEGDPVPEYKYREPPIKVPKSMVDAEKVEVSAPVVFKAIRCLEYQSCEHDGWKTSDAKQTCADLKCALYPNIARDRVLDEEFAPEGWDDAPWAIGD